MIEDNYYKSRYVWDKNREIVWKEIVRYLKPYIKNTYSVLDMGAGYCDFINNINCYQKTAIDISPEISKYANKDVFIVKESVLEMPFSDNSFDLIFASNLLEHFNDEDLNKITKEIKRVLKNNGTLILMQPNYRLSYKNYFDDPTHKKVFSDESLKSFILSFGFEIEKIISRFLPFSMKSKPSLLPISNILIRIYLNLPFKPFAGQMLLIAKNKKDEN